MLGISVIILTKNEENNILDCLESIREAGEIIVVDDYSEDRTREIIKNFDNKIKILKHKFNNDFSEQRNFGLNHARFEWILFIDADERVSEALASEIFQPKADGPMIHNVDGFYIKRRDVMWGRELKFGESGNIKLLRLARKNAGKWVGRVHEAWAVGGRVEELENDLIHYPHQTIREFLREISLYSSIRARELHEKRVKVSALDVIFYPKAKFFLNYFVKLGFFDGLPGLIVALMMSLHSFLVRGKLWLLQNENIN